MTRLNLRLLSLTFIALIVGTVHPTHAAGSDPPVIPLIKLEYPGQPRNIRMLYVDLRALGERQIAQPLLFDTGSAGVTVECSVVLPEKLCSHAGIKIDKETVIDGITVTTQKIVSHYGTYDEYGNLAFARMTIGRKGQSVATSGPVPFLVRYKKVRRSTGEIVGGPLWPLGVFGVSPVGGQVSGKLQSPMAAFEVAPGLHRGFYLSPIGTKWRQCTNEERNCPIVDALHIGIPDALRKNFKLSKWVRASGRHNFPTVETCIALENLNICQPTLFDTGNSTVMIAGQSKRSKSSLPIGTSLKVSGADFGTWRFNTTYRPEVELYPNLDTNIIGIRYFETNSLMFDLGTQEIGFRLGR